jgi:hypothetical protein
MEEMLEDFRPSVVGALVSQGEKLKIYTNVAQTHKTL